MASAAKARRLRLALRELREGAGLSLRDLGERLGGWSADRINRLELGTRRMATPEEVAAIATALGASDEVREDLVRLCHEAATRGWMAGIRDLPAQLVTLASYEDEALRETVVSTVVLPGLLQTEDYARGVMRKGGVAESEIPRRVELRRLRQRVLGGRLQVVGLLDESLLHRVVGSPPVTVGQFRHLLQLASTPAVRVHVIPFDARFAPVNGSYMVIEFAADPPVIYDEHVSGGTFVEDGPQVAGFLADLGRLTSVALGEHESAELIRATITRMEDR